MLLKYDAIYYKLNMVQNKPALTNDVIISWNLFKSKYDVETREKLHLWGSYCVNQL